MREGRPLPEKIQNAPILLDGLELFFVAWLELSSDRAYGMGEGPIPWTSIRNYANEYDIVGELREDLYYFVRSLDVAYLTHQGKKREREMKTKPTGGVSGPKRSRIGKT